MAIIKIRKLISVKDVMGYVRLVLVQQITSVEVVDGLLILKIEVNATFGVHLVSISRKIL
jgi:hypothetical protein